MLGENNKKNCTSNFAIAKLKKNSNNTEKNRDQGNMHRNEHA